jgi:hypothetical protein
MLRKITVASFGLPSQATRLPLGWNRILELEHAALHSGGTYPSEVRNFLRGFPNSVNAGTRFQALGTTQKNGLIHAPTLRVNTSGAEVC